MRFTGLFSAPQEGIYTFYLCCSPRGRLYFGRLPPCRKRGPKVRASGERSVRRGLHPIEFQINYPSDENKTLQVSVAGPQMPRQPRNRPSVSHGLAVTFDLVIYQKGRRSAERTVVDQFQMADGHNPILSHCRLWQNQPEPAGLIKSSISLGRIPGKGDELRRSIRGPARCGRQCSHATKALRARSAGLVHFLPYLRKHRPVDSAHEVRGP